ncbi:MAG: helix-turn-helix domain-containing protein [Actinomycetota bacterium]|nr:helix-turn-helix domain-containing protein [Actinomycetota bacterium]
MNPTIDIGARLFELREERGWSQTRTAKEAGVSQTSIVHIETGQVRPRLATLRRLAKGFGITVEELTGAPLAATPANSR